MYNGLIVEDDVFEEQELQDFKEYLVKVNEYLQINYPKNLETKIGNENYPFSTKILDYYNLFLFPNPHIYKLYRKVRKIVYEDGGENNRYFIRCWLNFFNRGQYLDWHKHWCVNRKSYHGFFCVEVENSYTDYKFNDGKILSITGKNNRIVIGKTYNNLHKTSEWEYEYPRITLAFDIHPVEVILEKQDKSNYWNPL